MSTLKWALEVLWLAKQNRLDGSFSALDNIDTFKEKISEYGQK